MAVDNSTIDKLVDALEKNTQSDREAIKQLQDLFGRGGGRGRGRSDIEKEQKAKQEEVNALRNSTAALDKLYDRITKAKTHWGKHSELSQEHKKSLETNIDKVLQSSQTLEQADRDRLSQAREHIVAGNNTAEALNSLSGITEQVAEAETKQYKETVQVTRHTNRFRRTIHQAGDQTKEFVSKMSSMSAAIGMATVGASRSFGVIEEAARTQAPVMSLMSGEFKNFAERFGFSSKHFMNVYSENAAAILGATQQMNTFEDSGREFIKSYERLSEELYNVTGDYEPALQLAGSSLTLFAKQGVRFTHEEMRKQVLGPDGTANTFAFLAAAGDKSVAEITEMTDSLMKEQSMRADLLGLNEEERKNRVRTLALQTKQLRVEGLSIERAMEFQKTLAEINQQQDPKSFMRGIARTAALAGGMGFGGQDTQKFMSVMMKAEGQRTGEDKQFIQQFVTRLEEQQAKMVGGKDLGTRLMGMQFKTMMPAEIKQLMSAGSTAAEQQAKLTDKQANILDETQPQIRQAAMDSLTTLKQIYQKVAAIAGSAEAGLLGGALSGVGSLLKNALDIGVYWKVLAGGKMPGGKMLSGVGKMAGGMGAGAMGMGSKALGAAGGAGGLAKSLGGVGLAGAGGFAFGTLVDKVWEKYHSESRAAFSDLLGTTVDSVAQLWSDDARRRLDLHKKMEQQREEQEKETNRRIQETNQLMKENNKLISEQNETQEKTSKNTASTANAINQSRQDQTQNSNSIKAFLDQQLRTQQIRAPGRRAYS